MQLRSAKGLCFNCDEKFSPTHKRPNKRLMLQWDDDTIVDEEAPAVIADNSMPVPTTDFTMEFDNPMASEETSTKHSLNPMNGALVSGSMRFSRIINGHLVQILLDGSSDDSFM